MKNIQKNGNKKKIKKAFNPSGFQAFFLKVV